MLLLYSVSMRACVCFLFFSEEKNAIFGESDSTILLHSAEFQASVTQNSKASTLSEADNWVTKTKKIESQKFP